MLEYQNERLQEFNHYLKNRKVALIGMGISNISLIGYLLEQEANVTVFDNRELHNLPQEARTCIQHHPVTTFLGKEYLSHLTGFDLIFRSPSCRPDIPELEAERNRGAIVTTEIEMFMKLFPGTIIGVTGSDGKTTTASLIDAIIKQKGYSCYLGGNIGNCLFNKLTEMKESDFAVLELSSFQLMDMEISPHIAVITNVSPNHLDVHTSYEEYIEAKKQIFQYQNENNRVILNYDNDITREFAKEAPGKVTFFSRKTKIDNGIVLDEDIIKIAENRLRKHVVSTSHVLLPGMHNYENICAAIGATMSFIDIPDIANANMHIKGVEHRLEFIRELDGIKWYNDSIGTSPTRTIAGLKSFQEKFVLIAGGYDKQLDYTLLAKPILDHVSTLILMGQTAGKIFDAVSKEMDKEKKNLPIYMASDLENSVKLARKHAKEGEVVLLSPASASFDMFPNFAVRGTEFKKLVNQL